MHLIRTEGKYEFWTHKDQAAEVYEVFLDPEGETYIGCCDDLQQVRDLIDEWLDERLGENN